MCWTTSVWSWGELKWLRKKVSSEKSSSIIYLKSNMIWLIHIQYSWSIVCNGLVHINNMEKKNQFMKYNIEKNVPLKDPPEREILHSFNAVNDASGQCSTKHWAHPLVFLGRALQRNNLRKQKLSIGMLQMTVGTWCFSTNVKTLIFLVCNWLWINCWAVRVEVWIFIYNTKYSTELCLITTWPPLSVIGLYTL